jgi:hypothetical protein
VLAIIFGLKLFAQDGLAWLPGLSILAGVAIGRVFVKGSYNSPTRSSTSGSSASPPLAPRWRHTGSESSLYSVAFSSSRSTSN